MTTLADLQRYNTLDAKVGRLRKQCSALQGVLNTANQDLSEAETLFRDHQASLRELDLTIDLWEHCTLSRDIKKRDPRGLIGQPGEAYVTRAYMPHYIPPVEQRGNDTSAAHPSVHIQYVPPRYDPPHDDSHPFGVRRSDGRVHAILYANSHFGEAPLDFVMHVRVLWPQDRAPLHYLLVQGDEGYTEHLSSLTAPPALT